MTAVLQAQGLAIALASGRCLVEGLEFSLRPGRTLGLVGESGSGKSLTALALLGLLEPATFRVGGGLVIQGRPCHGMDDPVWPGLRGRVLGMVFQEPLTALNPRMRVGRQIAEVGRRHLGMSRAEARADAVRWLDRVGIARASERAEDFPYAFSGGMRQRICLAMALAGRPKVLLADEPTTALDSTLQGQMLDLIQDLQREMGLAVLLITHDLALAGQRCDDLLVLYAGRAMEAGPAARVLGRPRHPYTQALLACARFPEQAGTPLATIPGQVPLVTPAASTPCVFADRCPKAREDCLVRPRTWFLQEPEGGHACFHPDAEPRP